MTKQILNLETIEVNQLPEIKGYEQKQKELVKNHPFIEITDSKTYDEAKKNRTALRGGRTELQNGEKTIASKLVVFRKRIAEEVHKLVTITIGAEEKQQAEIDRYEAHKQALKEEEERKEKERVENITKAIDAAQNDLKKLIDNVTFESIEEYKMKFLKLIGTASELFDYEEQQQFFDMMVNHKNEEFEKRILELEKNEQLRIENERLKIEAEAREKKLAEEREAQRLKDEEAAKERREMQAKIDAFEKAEREKREAEEKEKARLEQIESIKKAKELEAKRKKEDEKRQKELAPQKTEAIKLLLSKISQREFEQFKSDEINMIVENCIIDINYVIENRVEQIKSL